MTVHIITHEDCIAHEGGPGHPERPDRLRTVDALLGDTELTVRVARHEAPEARRDQLERLHPATHIDRVRDLSLAGGGALDPDTSVNGKSWDAALRAVGAGIRAVHLASETGENVFAPVRPPGHHAEIGRAMGFCLFGNIALAAAEARAEGLADEILIIDWDVHHGNGTQNLVENEPAIRFVSLHQWPLYPGTGRESERGVGNIWNVPRPGGRPPEEYVSALKTGIDASLDGFEPQLVLISAGYDAMLGDPLAGFTLEAEHYGDLLRHIRGQVPQAPIVAMLEGGYHLGNLRRGVQVTLEALDTSSGSTVHP